MALFLEAVDLSKASDERWYARSAKAATVALGEKGRERIFERLRRVLAS